jgi:tetratricopeptide (TPR) repeat protein
MRNLNLHQKVLRGLLLTTVLGALSVSLSACDLLKQLPFLNKPADSVSSSTPGAPAAKADAKQVKAHMDKGNALAKQGKWQEAQSEFAQVLAMDPNNTQAHVQTGWADAELQQWDDAQQHLLTAVSNDPNNASAHANLAWVYAEKKRWNDSEIEAKKAIDLDPKNPYPHATLAWTYQETKQDELAVAEYEKSIELNPALDNSHLAVGVLYCNKGMTHQAQEHYGHLVQLKSPKAAELQARISKGCGVGKK